MDIRLDVESVHIGTPAQPVLQARLYDWPAASRILEEESLMIEFAISIRQPYVEQIFRRIEESKPSTKIPGRVYVYANLRPGDLNGFSSLGAEKDFPTRVIVGSVEITGCRYSEPKQCYAYRLNPSASGSQFSGRTIPARLVPATNAAFERDTGHYAMRAAARGFVQRRQPAPVAHLVLGLITRNAAIWLHPGAF
jgi:hypothetical protein